MIICYTVPEIWCMDIILFHLELFFPLLPPLRPLTFETPGDIINLHNCTKNYDYRLYCSWDMVCECNCYFSFTLGYFLPSPPLSTINNSKSENFKTKSEKKNAWRFHHFTHVYQKLWLDTVWFLRYGVWWMDGKSDIQRWVFHLKTEVILWCGYLFIALLMLIKLHTCYQSFPY